MKIGAAVRTFNYEMRVRRIELGLTQTALAEIAGCSFSFVNTVENLRLPSGRISTISYCLSNIARALESDFDTLFPQDYLDAIQKRLLPKYKSPLLWVREIDISQFPLNRDELMLPNPEDDFINRQLSIDARALLLRLTGREASIIKMRFGFDEEAKTLEEIGGLLGFSAEYVNQIEARALKKLRHPTCAPSALADYYPTKGRLKHLKNIYDPKRKEAWSKFYYAKGGRVKSVPRLEWRKYLDWVNAHIIGLPKATKFRTVEQLVAKHIVGLYILDENEA